MSRCAIITTMALSLALAACDSPTKPSGASLAGGEVAADAANASNHVKHVLLISVDGMHELDLHNYIVSHPGSWLKWLNNRGLNFRNARSSKPSDSFPGLLALITGGTPLSTGVLYDVSYDRLLSPPTDTHCATHGTTVAYDESIDKDLTELDGGGAINTSALPLDGTKGCKRVFPHSFLRVNTIFEVIHKANLRTAWTDKHLSYDIVNGPSGEGVDDLYTPEIASTLPIGGHAEDNVERCEYYDALKVKATLNQIDGLDHAGAHHVGVPAIFGMNFQVVSVSQKTVGYQNAGGTPTAGLADGLDFVDQGLGQFVKELQKQQLLSNTLIIISAKHGQTPINPALHHIVDASLIGSEVNSVAANLDASDTDDDVSLIWLADNTKTAAVVSTLEANEGVNFFQSFLWEGHGITPLFADPHTDSRTPDIIGLPQLGVIYSGPTTKIAEHGGFNDDDNRVALLASFWRFKHEDVEEDVFTRQVAPSIVQALGLDYHQLQAVGIEGTQPLPELHEELVESHEGPEPPEPLTLLPE